MVIPGLAVIIFLIGMFAVTSLLKSDGLKRLDSLGILAALVLVGLFEYLNTQFFRFEWVVQLIVGAALLVPLILLMIISDARHKKIEELKVKVLDLITSTLPKIDRESIEVKTKDGKPQFVKFPVDVSYNEASTSQIIQKLQKIYPVFIWDGKTNMEDFEVVIEGFPPAPWPAKYPGSEEHRWSWIPLGLSHTGEVGWRVSNREAGDSSYRYANGDRAEVLELPSAPQGLYVGSTGGGKAMALGQIVPVRRS